jgi:hypothetical protein
LEVAPAAVIATMPARNSRRARGNDMKSPQTFLLRKVLGSIRTKRAHKFITMGWLQPADTGISARKTKRPGLD